MLVSFKIRLGIWKNAIKTFVCEKVLIFAGRLPVAESGIGLAVRIITLQSHLFHPAMFVGCLIYCLCSAASVGPKGPTLYGVLSMTTTPTFKSRFFFLLTGPSSAFEPSIVTTEALQIQGSGWVE